MYNLYFLKFNNYINRTIKKFDIIDDYSDYISGIRTNMNFNFNDGINTTTEAINLKSSDSEIMKSNYIIIEDIETLELSRWFIMECKKTRGKQYIFSLRRDLVADNYDDILNSTSFIYKGYVEYPDPACIIKENLSFNQVKKNELYLKDGRYPVPCIVAYVSKQTTDGEQIVSFKFEKNVDVENIDNWFGKSYLSFLTNNNLENYKVIYTATSQQRFEYVKEQYVDDVLKQTENVNNAEFDELMLCQNFLFKINGKLYQLKVSEEQNIFKTTITFNELNDDDVTINARVDLGEKRVSLDDGYFDIIYIPLCNCISGDLIVNKKDILSIFTSMANNSAFFDVQLLPYFPEETLEFNTIDLGINENAISYPKYTIKNEYYVGSKVFNIGVSNTSGYYYNAYAFWASTSKRTFNIDYYDLTNSEVEMNVPVEIIHGLEKDEYKTIANTQTLRLCSPDENSIYEFNSAPNSGIKYYNVDIKLNPYNPYIHINPKYNWLNGNIDFNDYRGLICKGNFSLGRATNSWEEYQIQNKNFQQTFDRQIDVMQQEIKWGLASGIINTVASGVSGGAMGAAGGVAGIIAGAVAGTAQGVYNTVESQILSRENLQAQIDIFNYNLGSIKARPNSISNNSVLDNNNKIFPYVEVYECTDIEKEIFENIIKYQGMTINRIGKIKDFLGNENFIQARIVRTDLSDDNNFIEELNNELMKGVFFNAN